MRVRSEGGGSRASVWACRMVAEGKDIPVIPVTSGSVGQLDALEWHLPAPHLCSPRAVRSCLWQQDLHSVLSCCSVSIPTVQQRCQTSPAPLLFISHWFHVIHTSWEGWGEPLASAPFSNAHHGELQRWQLQATHCAKIAAWSKETPFGLLQIRLCSGQEQQSLNSLPGSHLTSDPCATSVPRAEASKPSTAALGGWKHSTVLNLDFSHRKQEFQLRTTP